MRFFSKKIITPIDYFIILTGFIIFLIIGVKNEHM